jgi:hypothetical protein
VAQAAQLEILEVILQVTTKAVVVAVVGVLLVVVADIIISTL